MIIETIDDLLPAIEGKDEFKVMDKADGYTVIDYLFMDKNTFDDERCLECRGIKFDTNGKLLARPLKKFFNLGEREAFDEVDWTKTHEMVDKLDGSMIHPAMVNGELRLMTRKGITDVAKRAEDLFLKRPVYFNFMAECIERNETPIFEFTGPSNRIVLRYDKHELSLLAVRMNHHGKTWSAAAMSNPGFGSAFPHIVRERMDYDHAHTHDFLEILNDEEGIEGVVVQFHDGHMLKVKTEEYVFKHRALEDMGSKKKVLNLVLSGYADDVKPTLDEADRVELEEFESAVLAKVKQWSLLVADVAGDYMGRDDYTRKQFAIHHKDEKLRSAMFTYMDSDDTAYEVVRKFCLKNLDWFKHIPWRGE